MPGKPESFRIVRIVAAGIAIATVLCSLKEPRQGRAQSPSPRSFEVASIRPSGKLTKSTPLDKMEVTPGGRFTASAVSVSKLIQTAYDIKPFQIIDAPDWLGKERYNIVAKAEMPSISPDQLKVLLQSLLAERFNLQFHHETRKIPVYELLVGKSGHKLQESDIQPDTRGDTRSANTPNPAQTGMIRLAKTGLVGQMVQVSTIADMMTKLLDRPVVDRTDIMGCYDFSLQLAMETLITIKGGGKFKGATVNDGSMLPSAPSGFDIFRAVQDQLGLKLEAQKSPFEVLVIDSIERVSGY